VGYYFFSGLVFCYFKEVNQLVARLVKYHRQNLPGMCMVVVLEGLCGTEYTGVHGVTVLWSCALRSCALR